MHDDRQRTKETRAFSDQPDSPLRVKLITTYISTFKAILLTVRFARSSATTSALSSSSSSASGAIISPRQSEEYSDYFALQSRHEESLFLKNTNREILFDAFVSDTEAKQHGVDKENDDHRHRCAVSTCVYVTLPSTLRGIYSRFCKDSDPQLQLRTPSRYFGSYFKITCTEKPVAYKMSRISA